MSLIRLDHPLAQVCPLAIHKGQRFAFVRLFSSHLVDLAKATKVRVNLAAQADCFGPFADELRGRFAREPLLLNPSVSFRPLEVVVGCVLHRKLIGPKCEVFLPLVIQKGTDARLCLHKCIIHRPADCCRNVVSGGVAFRHRDVDCWRHAQGAAGLAVAQDLPALGRAEQLRPALPRPSRTHPA